MLSISGVVIFSNPFITLLSIKQQHHHPPPAPAVKANNNHRTQYENTIGIALAVGAALLQGSHIFLVRFLRKIDGFLHLMLNYTFAIVEVTIVSFLIHKWEAFWLNDKEICWFIVITIGFQTLQVTLCFAPRYWSVLVVIFVLLSQSPIIYVVNIVLFHSPFDFIYMIGLALIILSGALIMLQANSAKLREADTNLRAKLSCNTVVDIENTPLVSSDASSIN